MSRAVRYAVVEQDERYRRLQTLGRAVDHAGARFELFDLRPFLEAVLATRHFDGREPTALEYGTGTGAGACFLAARGFRVDAIDVAPTAIALARTFAAERGVCVNYAVQDICDLDVADRRYDLVVDNFCLQRLVTNERRERALAVVRSVLKPTGCFVIGTAVFREGRTLRPDEFRDGDTGIVYRRLPPGTPLRDDLIVRDGEVLYPRVRRVRPATLRVELERAGFDLLSQDGGRVLATPKPHPRTA
jgi:SAM-dependent methyltransferase